MKWLNQLLAHGIFIGRARPKAGVLDERGALWIAKFPRRSIAKTRCAWEAVVHDMAQAAGLCVPDARR
jgi:serine/threonine-protein kinase HipA